MAVKVCINGEMKKIDTTLHKPVIFLNGEKKVLAKAWTFINGEKKTLWGQAGVQVDLIRGDGILAGNNSLVAIGENWATMAGNGGGDNYVSRIDISNLSLPSVIQTVAWGYKVRNNTFLSDTSKLVFYGRVSSGTLNRLACNYSSGAITVENSYAMAGYTPIGDIGGSSIEYETLRRAFTQPTSLTRTYGTRFYVNGSAAYSFGHQPSSVSDSNYGPYLSSVGLQYASNAWYGIFRGYGSYLSDTGTWSIGTASASKVSSSLFQMQFIDGDNIVCDGNTINLVDKTSLAVVYSGEDLTLNGMTFKNIGRNGDYYYVVQYPSTAVLNGVVTLYLFDKDDLSTVYTQTLPSDPFGEYGGVSTFWNNCVASPQTTGSGFLGVSATSSGIFRIVRFSELL